MTDSSRTRRQRGIKASPQKLTRARKAAGFASQAAVAEKIADMEGLDNPPKDVVNRAFRGVKVSQDTIDRLALALDVEAHSLLLTSDEDIPTTRHDEPDAALHPGGSRWPWVLGAALALMLFGLLALVSTQRGAPVPQTADTRIQFAVNPALAHLSAEDASLDIELSSAELDDAFAAALRTALEPHFAVPSAAASQLRGASEDRRTIGAVTTDARLIVGTQRQGRWLGIVAVLDTRGVRLPVWSDSLSVATLADRTDALAQQLTESVLAAVGRTQRSRQAFLAGPEPQLDYLSGMALLDGPSEELTLQRAQARFEAALRRSPDYARAHAGLCRALLEKYWMLDEARAIDDAALTCARAHELAPNDPRVRLARVRLMQINGRNDAAIAELNSVLEQAPKNADAWTLLAQSQLTRFQTSGESDALQRGREAAQKAAAADPDIWQPYFRLGLIEYLSNDVEQAIVATKRGLERSENAFLLANLSSYQTCAGDFAAAERAVMRAQALSPAAYIGDEFLSQLKYFQGQFDDALALRQAAIESFEEAEPAFHDMWGALADAHRQVGQLEEAVRAYSLAINIVETDLLNSDASQSARAARLYYYARVHQLDEQALAPDVVAQLGTELQEVASAQTEPIGMRYIALALALHGNRDDARAFLDKATTRCRGYRQYPDFADLLETPTR
jgi:tetratricopeptide (TPR) repeat protein